MTLVLFQTIVLSIASTLSWVGLYVGIRALPGEQPTRLRWTVGSAAALLVWIVGVILVRYFQGGISGVFAIPLESATF